MVEVSFIYPILIETMRREGYEFQVSRPEVLYKTDEDGKKIEPMELVTIDVPEEFVGAVIEKLGTRKGEMVNMAPGKVDTLDWNLTFLLEGLLVTETNFLQTLEVTA